MSQSENMLYQYKRIAEDKQLQDDAVLGQYLSKHTIDVEDVASAADYENPKVTVTKLSPSITLPAGGAQICLNHDMAQKVVEGLEAAVALAGLMAGTVIAAPAAAVIAGVIILEGVAIKIADCGKGVYYIDNFAINVLGGGLNVVNFVPFTIKGDGSPCN